MIDRATLTQLVAGADPAVSIYLPTDPEQRGIRGADAERRECAELARQRLERRGMDAEQIMAMLAPIADADLERELEEHRGYGRVWFLSPTLREVFALPEPLPRAVSVERNFLLRPLLPALARNRGFHILALSAIKSRLLDATPFAVSERAFVLPASAEAVFVEPEAGRTIPLHPTGRPPAAGPAEETTSDASGPTERIDKEEFLLEMNHMAAAVASALTGDLAPLVLIAEPETAGHFRKAAGNKLPQLYEEALTLDPSGLGNGDLLRRAVALLQPVFERELASVLDQANARLGTAESTVAIRLEEILAAAYDGRVDAVVVASDETLPGRFDPEARTLHTKGGANGEGEDLLNEAAVVSLRNGGRAFALPKGRIPRRAPAVAVLRY